MVTIIVWFRSDLRVADNPALHHALARGERIVPVYIDAPEELSPWQPGAASRWWLHHSLTALHDTLARLGSRLIVRRGASGEVLRTLVRERGASEVHWNRVYESAAARRDEDVIRQLQSTGVQTHTHHAGLLFEPGSVRNKQGEPYRVFTPFRRAYRGMATPPPLGSPRALPPVSENIDSLPISQLELLPTKPWYGGLQETWRPGEAGAHQRLQAFCQSALAHYPQWRDLPDRPGTSRLSPYMHFGEISARQIAWTLQDCVERAEDACIAQAVESLHHQLIWREFAHHLLHHFPHTSETPFDARYHVFPWSRDDALLRAWQLGHTGIPIIDAGMRQLWQTGWMHNRVRMLVASFLTKNCRVHWLDGARWFWETSTDADLANNSFNWQWVAGCGVDAAPYYRIFNPLLQANKFDGGGRYVRRWLPELAALPDRWLHQPWRAPAKVLSAAGLRIGSDYPAPIIDIAESGRTALTLWRDYIGRNARKR